MQAADLLSLLVPGLTAGAAQPGAPGAAVGKGGLALGKAGQAALAGAADGAAGADATNPFAEALAALMAAQGQVAPTPAAAPATVETQAGMETETTDAAADQPNKGLQTALAATAKAGAQARGLVKALGNQADPALTGETALTSPEIQAAANEAATPAQPTAASPTTAKALPEQAKAAEALADRLASPSPRSDRAVEVAKGAQLPAWARSDPPAATPAPSTPAAVKVEAPATAPAQTAPVAETADAPPPTTPVGDPAVATTQQAAVTEQVAGLAGAQVAAQGSDKTSDPTPSPRAEGKAKGQDKSDDDAPEVHAPRGIGKGLATAPGQLKKTSGEQSQSDTPPSDAGTTQTAAADKVSRDNASANPLAAADSARANTFIPAHADRVQASSHTVAHLVEQIADKADGKSTRFDVTLDPAGLGKVDVKIEIGRDGGVSAALTFDNPQAAAELKSRAGELRTALEQAGFDLSKGGLSFDLSGQNQGRNLWDQQDQAPRPSWAKASFVDLAQAADPPGLSRHRTIDAGGVDVTV